ncbi:MAG: hypothetical protein EHM23_12395 [Acidobacteria bacterium]|nr:MAG: hypothetical protein EHM23_12395 [Acidobacteriota bacterium]
MAEELPKTRQRKSKLSLDLREEQVKALAPLLEATGRVQILGTLEGNQLRVSYIACNAAFLACNAAFKIESL